MMEFRDQCAIAAMQAIAKKFSYKSMTFEETLFYSEQIALNAYRIADAMVKVKHISPEDLKPSIEKIPINGDLLEEIIREEGRGDGEIYAHQIKGILGKYLNRKK